MVTAVTGMVLLPEGAVLPADAVITVAVEDVSLADAPAVVIGEQVLAGSDATDEGIPFSVEYDAAVIVEVNSYAMSALIEGADGELLFVNDSAIPVITGDNPTEDVVVPVIVVEGPIEPTPSASPSDAVASPGATEAAESPAA